MRQFNLRYLYTAAATAAVTAAAIAIPAWGDSGGDGSSANGDVNAAALPAPPGGAGSAVRAQFPSAAEMKQNRAKLDEFTTCLRDNGFDVPTPPRRPDSSSSQAPAPPSKAEMEKATKECGTPPAPPAGLLPPLSKKQVEQARKAMAKGDCPPLPVPPPRGSK